MLAMGACEPLPPTLEEQCSAIRLQALEVYAEPQTCDTDDECGISHGQCFWKRHPETCSRAMTRVNLHRVADIAASYEDHCLKPFGLCGSCSVPIALELRCIDGLCVLLSPP
jgi:hypothetical protein